MCIVLFIIFIVIIIIIIFIIIIIIILFAILISCFYFLVYSFVNSKGIIFSQQKCCCQYPLLPQKN